MSNNYVRTILAIGFPLTVIGSIILAISYVNDQQNLRAMANEPQEYVARDAALRVAAAGALPTSGFGSAIPIESDPAAYVVFYDATGTPVAGTGILHGAAPHLPAGIFEVAKKQGVNRLTWQPEKDVRQAIIVIPAGDGYVMSGRSLAYTEEQESALGKRALIGWLATMVGVVIVSIVTAYLLRKRED